MPLTKNEIRTAVIEALHAVGEDAEWPEITAKTKPIGHLGLESIDGLDFCLELEDRLQCKIDQKLNPLVNDAQRRPRTVEEIVGWLETHAEPCEEEAIHE